MKDTDRRILPQSLVARCHEQAGEFSAGENDWLVMPHGARHEGVQGYLPISSGVAEIDGVAVLHDHGQRIDAVGTTENALGCKARVFGDPHPRKERRDGRYSRRKFQHGRFRGASGKGPIRRHSKRIHCRKHHQHGNDDSGSEHRYRQRAFRVVSRCHHCVEGEQDWRLAAECERLQRCQGQDPCPQRNTEPRPAVACCDVQRERAGGILGECRENPEDECDACDLGRAVHGSAKFSQVHPDRHCRERDNHQHQKLSAMHRAGPSASRNVRVVAQKSDDGFRDEVVPDEQRTISSERHHQCAPNEIVKRYSDQPSRKGARVVHEVHRSDTERQTDEQRNRDDWFEQVEVGCHQPYDDRKKGQEEQRKAVVVRRRVHRADRKRHEKDESEHQGGRCTGERSR